jgi:hypothetical protein
MCILLTLLPAGVMYALNFERLGQPERKKRTLFFVLGFAVIYYLLTIRFVLLPDYDRATELSVRAWYSIINIVIAWRFYLGQQGLFVRIYSTRRQESTAVDSYSLSALWILTFVAGSVAYTVIDEEREFDRAVTLMSKGQNRDAEAIFKKHKANIQKKQAHTGTLQLSTLALKECHWHNKNLKTY